MYRATYMIKHCRRKLFAHSDIFSGIVGVFSLPSCTKDIRHAWIAHTTAIKHLRCTRQQFDSGQSKVVVLSAFQSWCTLDSRYPPWRYRVHFSPPQEPSSKWSHAVTFLNSDRTLHRSRFSWINQSQRFCKHHLPLPRCWQPWYPVVYPGQSNTPLMFGSCLKTYSVQNVPWMKIGQTRAYLSRKVPCQGLVKCAMQCQSTRYASTRDVF